MAGVNGDLAVVVGGASGIGAACVTALMADGWTVANADLRTGDHTAEGVAGFAAMDIRDADAVRSGFHELADAHGPLRAVVHTAGPAGGAASRDPAQAVEPHRRRESHRRGQRAADGGTPDVRRREHRPRLLHRRALRDSGPQPLLRGEAGVESLVRSAGLKLGGAKIRCNPLAPGVVRAPRMEPALNDPMVEQAFLDRIPLGWISRPEDIAASAAFLVSNAAAWITGITLTINGEMSLREHPSLFDPSLAEER